MSRLATTTSCHDFRGCRDNADMSPALPHSRSPSATLPHLVTIAGHGVVGSAKVDAALGLGLSTIAGKLVSQPVAEAHGLPFADPSGLLASAA